MKKLLKVGAALLMGSTVILQGCSNMQAAQDSGPDAILPAKGEAVATFAGGCFWCVEAGFEKIQGVSEVVSGYTAGQTDNPTYKKVSSGSTGHTEAVQVYYNPNVITYEQLLEGFWRQFDPTDGGGSFFDRGSQYRPGIYYNNDKEKIAAEAAIAKQEASGRYEKPFALEVAQLGAFYQAEERHQNYYTKNPLRYRYYRAGSGRDKYLEKVWGDDLKYLAKGTKPKKDETSTKKSDQNMSDEMKNDSKEMSQAAPRDYSRPSEEVLRGTLTDLQYRVTQKAGTERPFENEYNDNKEEGIYVDIVSGEPLFSSKDKYDSGTGWPSFSQPIKKEHIATKTDFKLIYPRTEVLSAGAGSHLGHVFKDGPAPTGLRYCLNSASLRFVPKDSLDSEGYGEFVAHFSE